MMLTYSSAHSGRKEGETGISPNFLQIMDVRVDRESVFTFVRTLY